LTDAPEKHSLKTVKPFPAKLYVDLARSYRSDVKRID
jgi:hypothetical protein